MRQNAAVGNEDVLVPSDDEGPRPAAGGGVPPSTAGSSLINWWHGQTKTRKIIISTFTVLVTTLAGWGTIRDVLVDPLQSAWENRQPQHDEKVINCLDTGMQLTSFEECLNVKVFTIPRTDILVSNELFSRDEMLSERVYLLDTVYVQAFVDKNYSVEAYTITARQSKKMPQNIDMINSKINFGSTRIAEVSTNAQRVAVVNGLHIQAYYELLTPNNFSQERAMAVGMTEAGALPVKYSWPRYSIDVEGLPLLPGTNPGDEKYYAIGIYEVGSSFLKRDREFAAQAVINTAAVTAPGVPMIPQFISLHPDIVSMWDANSS